MSTLFKCPPDVFVKHDDFGQKLEQKFNSPASRDASLLRDDHIVLLSIDVLLALHASFKKWRRHRRALRALADLDERQLNDIGFTRDEAWSETAFKLLGSPKELPRACRNR